MMKFRRALIERCGNIEWAQSCKAVLAMLSGEMLQRSHAVFYGLPVTVLQAKDIGLIDLAADLQSAVGKFENMQVSDRAIDQAVVQCAAHEVDARSSGSESRPRGCSNGELAGSGWSVVCTAQAHAIRRILRF